MKKRRRMYANLGLTPAVAVIVVLVFGGRRVLTCAVAVHFGYIVSY